MSNPFDQDYDLHSLERVTVGTLGFDLYTTPRFRDLYATQIHGQMTPLLVRQMAKGVRTFIDVGAHQGLFSVLAGLSSPDCRVLAFEPVPENVEIVKRNLRLNGVTADLHQAAVSDAGGRVVFQVSEASDSSGFIANPAAAVARRMKAEVLPLDQFFNRIEPGPVLVKIDVEGNEPRVLEGMRRIIDECDDLRMVIEFNPRCLEVNGNTPEALLGQLDQLGFDSHFVFDSEQCYARFRRGQDWRDFMQGETSRNLYCVKKDLSLSLCVFSHSATLGGAELSLLEVIDNMTKRYGTLFTVMLPAAGPLQRRLVELGAATIPAHYRWWCTEVPSSGKREAGDSMLASYANVDKTMPALFKLSPDAVLTTTLVIPWGAVAAMRLDLPHIWWVKEFAESDGWGFRFRYSRKRSLRMVEEASNHVVVNSQAVRTAVFPDAGPEKCSVAMNRIVLKPHVDHTEAYFRRSGSIRVAVVGDVKPAKGQEDAVRAVARLLQEGRDVELCIAGIGPTVSDYCRRLQALVEKEGMADRIHFQGYLENIRPLMEQAHIGVSCARSEAFGRTTAEAMMLGRPAIGTDVGGTTELIEDGVTGFLYPPGDVTRLADRIAFFVDHPEAMQDFGERAEAAILEKLADNPIDSHLFALGRACRGEGNPYSPQLTELVLGWRRRLEGQPRETRRQDLAAPTEVAHLRAELAEQYAKIADIYASTSWRVSAPVRIVGRRAGRLSVALRRRVGRLVRSHSRGQTR